MIETVLGVLLWIVIAVIGGAVLYVVFCVVMAIMNYGPKGPWN